MYCLWKTAGATVTNWQETVYVGAVQQGASLYLSLQSDSAWSGKLRLSPAFHRDYLHVPINYPRINQFQEWFPIDGKKSYTLTNTKTKKAVTLTGKTLLSGYAVSLKKGETLRLIIQAR